MWRKRNFGFSSETRKASKKPGSVASVTLRTFTNPDAPAFSTSLACNAEVVEVCAGMRSLSWDEVAGKTDTVAAEIAGIAAVAIYEMSSSVFFEKRT